MELSNLSLQDLIILKLKVDFQLIIKPEFWFVIIGILAMVVSVFVAIKIWQQ